MYAYLYIFWRQYINPMMCVSTSLLYYILLCCTQTKIRESQSGEADVGDSLEC